MAKVSTMSAVIPPNEALSGTVDIGSHTIIGFEMPEAWAGTSITFQSKAKASEDVTDAVGAQQADEDLDNVYDSAGSEITVTVAANRVVVPTAAHAAALAPLRFIRIRSGTSAAPVAQNPQKTIRLLLKGD